MSENKISEAAKDLNALASAYDVMICSVLVDANGDPFLVNNHLGRLKDIDLVHFSSRVLQQASMEFKAKENEVKIQVHEAASVTAQERAESIHPKMDYPFQFTSTRYSGCVMAFSSWRRYLVPPLEGKPVHGLEIGSFEGRSAVWFMENVLTHPDSQLICIDTFQGGRDQHELPVNCTEMRDRFFHNLKPWANADKLLVLEHQSQIALRSFDPEPHFDFIYIDGSHDACDVLEDAVLAWRLVKPGGFMIFDDYEWKYPSGDKPLLEARMAIDAFLACFEGQYELVDKGWQLAVRKAQA